MRNRLKATACALVIAVQLSACTSIPKSTTPESRFTQLNCAEIDAELAMAADTGRVASKARKESWHVVLPLLVAVRYVDADSSLKVAEGRAARLREQQADKGCSKAPA